MGQKAYIGIGTNLGDRLGNYRKALEKLGELAETRVTRTSSRYESEPHGKARNWFLNGVAEIETDLEAKALLKALQKIETELGRKRDKAKKTVSREMDLDILFYEQDISETRTLKIPHPELPNRKFVLMPLAELIPTFAHPVSGETVSSLLAACQDDKRVVLFKG